MNQPTIVIIYSHKDEDWKDRIVCQLKSVNKNFGIDLFDDHCTEAGEHWYKKIYNAMNEADLSLFLVTDDFLKSAFFLKENTDFFFGYSFNRQKFNDLSSYLVIVKPCAWQTISWLSKIIPLSGDLEPLSSKDAEKIDAYLNYLSLKISKLLEIPEIESISIPRALYDPKPKSVEFAIFAPRSITPNSSFILDVWAYLPNQYSYITTIVQKHGRDVNLGSKTGVPVPMGAILTIEVNVDGLEVQDPIDTIVWNSEPTNASFIIKVPTGCLIGKYSGRAIIKHRGIAIAKIVFLIFVDTFETLDYIDHSAKVVYPKSAFASYASVNRMEVLSRIQGMKKIAPELDIFVDTFSLRSGQNWQEKLEQHVPTKDAFYLFWSYPASRSEWVEREWRLALSKRGLNYIDPVPLEEPDHVPPPQELSALHFSDAYIAYIKYESVKWFMQNRSQL